MTPQNVITDARYVLLDTDSTAYRQSDDELLGYVNDGIREAAIIQPALFSTIADYTCVPGQCEQAITYADGFALLEVLCLHGGTALIPFDIDTMNAFNPNWRSDTAGAATQWSKFANDPFKFFIYPAAPAAAQVLDVRYIRTPTANFGLTDTITDLPDGYRPALSQYVVYRTNMKDDEFVNSNRAVQMYQAFVSLLKGA